MKRVGVALSVALAVAACNGSGSDSSLTTTTSLEVTTTAIVPTTTTSTPTTSTTTTTTTTVAPTTVPPAPSTAPPTVPEIVIPDGAPSRDEIVRIVNHWGVRVVEMYSDPVNGNVGSICFTNSPCFENFQTDLAAVLQDGQHLENAQPFTVNHLRFVEVQDGGRLLVSYRTNPTDRGRLVGPAGDIDLGGSPTGAAGLLTLMPYGEDPEFPWRAYEYLPDPE